MGEKEFVKLCRKRVAEYYGWKHYTTDDIYIVWLSKTIQNNKALLSTNAPDGMYFECTYDGDKKRLYFDGYKRVIHEEAYGVEEKSKEQEPNKLLDDFQKELNKITPDLKLLSIDEEPKTIYWCSNPYDETVLYSFKDGYSVAGLLYFSVSHGQTIVSDLKDMIQRFNKKWEQK